MEPVIVIEDTVAALDKFTDETVRSEWCSGHKQFLISKHAHVPRPCHGLTRSPQSVQCFGNWDWCRECQEEPSFIQHCSDSGDRVTVVFWTQTISYFQARTFPATMPWVGMQSTECVVFWKLRLVSWMPRRTRYAAVDVPAGHHRSTCYKHMGHSDSVNENIYQVPPAEAEILRVSAVLQQFDSIFFSFSVTVIIIVNLSIIFQLFCHFSYSHS